MKYYDNISKMNSLSYLYRLSFNNKINNKNNKIKKLQKAAIANTSVYDVGDELSACK